MTLSGASAQEKAPEKAEVRGTILVQLRSFSVPVVNSAGGRAQGPISLFLVVRGEKNFTTICHNLPRIREAIALTVDQSPILVIEGKYQLDEIGVRLYREINRALPSPMVINLHLLPMARRLGEGAVNLELRGSNKDCMGIQKLPLDVATMLRAENPVARTFTVAEPEAAPKPEAKPRAKPKSKRRRDTAPAVIAPTLKSETPIQKTPNPDACQGLADVWKASSHTVSGTRYWLDRAFTLDGNNDGVVDDIGFILKTEGKADITIYYFPGQGRQSVIAAPALRLKDDRDLEKICFGQEEFKKPEPEKKGGGPSTFQVPDLAAELAFKASGGKAKGPAEKPSFLEGPGLVFAIVIGAGVLLIGGGGVGYAVARWRRERRRKERRAKRDRRDGDGDRRRGEGAF
ncbi:MAG: hypothetical protein IIC56_12205, partial [Proteobacteria bacterium]|nr:hypothetical protein [Pseudomonadota bacterium]